MLKIRVFTVYSCEHGKKDTQLPPTLYFLIRYTLFQFGLLCTL